MKVQVLINPAAGVDEPVLGIVNRILVNRRDISWEFAVTTPTSSAAELARDAASRGVDRVVVYGGDGTVSSAAEGLAGSDVTLAVLPGGTNNVFAQALGVPDDLSTAAELAFAHTVDTTCVDTLRVGSRHGLVRVGIGADARMIGRTSRAKKDKLGWLAYAMSAIEQAATATAVDFEVTVDDHSYRVKGLACIVSNIAQIGRAGLRLPGEISPFDGLADVLLIRRADLESVRSVLTKRGQEQVPPPFDQSGDASIAHTRGSRIHIAATPAQPAQVDGDLVGETPLDIEVSPGSLRVVIPRRLSQAGLATQA